MEPKEIFQKEVFDYALRPKTLKEFIGQEKLKQNFSVFIKAAKKRGEPLDHCLFYSPPGLGKTTLAHILGREMGVNIHTTSGPVLDRVGDLAAMLTRLSEGDIFFIDEIHRLQHSVEEALYPAMEDFAFYITTGKGPSAQTLKLAIPRFTLVGATTRAGLLTSPLRDRFGIVGHIEFYDQKEMEAIVFRSTKILEAPIEPEGARLIASRSRGTPRIANRLLRRIRDFAQVENEEVITEVLAKKALESLEVDHEGLDASDRKLLKTLVEKFSGGPVGLDSLAVAISEEIETLSDVYEPYLIQAGFLMRTARGRVVTLKAYKHLNIQPPKTINQPELKLD